MKRVFFLRAGTPYGYGYAAGEYGFVSDDRFLLLERIGVVRLATDDEFLVPDLGASGFDTLDRDDAGDPHDPDDAGDPHDPDDPDDPDDAGDPDVSVPDLEYPAPQSDAPALSGNKGPVPPPQKRGRK